MAAKVSRGTSEAEVRAQLRARADQVSTRVPAPGETESAARPAPARPAAAAPRAPTESAAAAPARRADRPAGPAPQRTPMRATPAQGRRRTPGAPRATGRGAPGARNYQAIILAEFVAAELLIAATPIATRQNQPGLSPYVPRDLSKLLAVGAVYFLLELAATTGSGAGRFGAWFGLLILLTVGVNEGNNIVQDLDLLAGIKGKLAAAKQTVTGHQET